MIQTDEKSQAEARDYVLNRQLTKPSTTVLTPVFFVLGIIVVGNLRITVVGGIACGVQADFYDLPIRG